MSESKIMIVEDEEIVARDLAYQLKKMGHGVTRHVTSGEAALEAAVEERPDLALMDINIEGRLDGIETATRLRGELEIPVIFITAFDSDEVLQRARGVEPLGYLVKPIERKDFRVLMNTALHRARMERKLRESEERFRTVAEFTYDWELWSAPDGRLLYISPSCLRITGYPREAFLEDPGMLSRIAHPEDRKKVDRLRADHLSQGEVIHLVFRIIAADGAERWISHYSQPVYGEGGAWLGWRSSNRDVTETRSLQERLLQVRNRETIATLAGGIAHEFNNKLFIIRGNVELLSEDFQEKDRLAPYTHAIEGAVEKMTDLTNHLLAYAQEGKYFPQMLRLNDFIRKSLQIMKHVEGTSRPVRTEFSPDVGPVRADHAQMQTVLSALLTNAAEASGDDGPIRITTRRMEVAEPPLQDGAPPPPGPYIRLSVSDDGVGMDAETARRAFDPFFTTKFQGRGLGLAAVSGIVKNHGGWIEVVSAPGEGATFHVFVPAADRPLEEVRKTSGKPVRGTGTILLIEDEPTVIEVAEALIRHLGYEVLRAEDGKTAVSLAESFDGPIHLALLDVLLPDMDGLSVYRRLRAARPGVKVIVCSGYAVDGPAQGILDQGAEAFLAKPYGLGSLSEKIKAVMAAPGAAGTVSPPADIR